MHSHDRTLLAKLGFADPDKKDPRHDLACLYLKEAPVRDRIGVWIANRVPVLLPDRTGEALVGVTLPPPSIEYHLGKGAGQYATTIGFLDALFEPSYRTRTVGVVPEHVIPARTELVTRRRREDPITGRFLGWEDEIRTIEPERVIPAHLQSRESEWSRPLFAEVKINPTGIGDILRQMNLYDSYVHTLESDHRLLAKYGLPRGLVLTAWRLTEAEDRAICDAGYGCLTLGAGFEEWCAAQTAGRVG